MSATERPFENQQRFPGAFISRRRLVIAIAILLIIAVVIGIVITTKLRGRAVERGQLALIDAFSNRRMIEPRLSGGFKGGAFKPSLEDLSGVKTEAFDDASDLITDAAASGDSGADVAYARLLLSKSDKLPEALKYLRSAVARAPESAEVHNDLGVCFLQQNKIEDAIDEFEVALSHRPDMPEALFNRALSYQRLLLSEAARRDFDRLVQVEQDKTWVVEIERRGRELSNPPGNETNPAAEFDTAFASGRIDDAQRLAGEKSELLRKHVFWRLVLQHLQSVVDGDAESGERSLAKIRLIGKTLIEKIQDSEVEELAKYLGTLSATDGRTELALVKDYFETSQVRPMTKETAAVFVRLEKEFRARGNDVYEMLSAFRVADQYYDLDLFNQSVDKLKLLLASAESARWPFDRARFLNVLALDTSRLGHDSLAIKYFQEAASVCRESPELEAKILQYMSVPYLQLGDIDGALERLRDSTKSYQEIGMPTLQSENLAYNYAQIADIYSRRNRHALALLYADHALNYSEQAKKYEYVAEFSSFVAVEKARLGRNDEAGASLESAFAYLDQAKQDREVTEARILCNGIEVASRNGDLQRALGYYERAEQLDEGGPLLKIDLLRARANAYLASGENENARADLLRAVAEIERYRSNIATSNQRSHFLDASHRVFDQLISLDVALNRVAEAFEMSERSRARALLEEISNRAKAPVTGTVEESASVAPLSLADIQLKLPDDLTVLQYSVTSKGTYIFLITRSELKVKESSATTETLDRLAREYISKLQSIASIDEVKENARELYNFLIKPVEEEINGVVNLCIVPDKALHFLPFAGLVDGSQQYLVTTRRLSSAPSASVLSRCLDEDTTLHSGPENLFSVGDPEFDSESFPELRPLEDAEREADQSARFYGPGSVTLVGAEATEMRVRSAIRDCDVAHLAVHCLVDESSPWLAALVLASPGRQVVAGNSAVATTSGTTPRSAALAKALPQEPVVDPNDGLLYLNELYGMKLPRTKLVVLSACQSGLGQYYRGEGIVSLVRPLLAAGVPTVVASLWPVDSKATSDLMIEFHKQRKLNGGMHTAEALRRAQIELARTSEHPFYWAPFIVVGGSSASN